jgi:hypothetical protein
MLAQERLHNMPPRPELLFNMPTRPETMPTRQERLLNVLAQLETMPMQLETMQVQRETLLNVLAQLETLRNMPVQPEPSNAWLPLNINLVTRGPKTLVSMQARPE